MFMRAPFRFLLYARHRRQGKDTASFFLEQCMENHFLNVKIRSSSTGGLRSDTGSLGETTDLRREFRILVRSEDPLFHGASLQDAMFPFRPEQTSVSRRYGSELQPLRLCDEIRPGTVSENVVGDFGEGFVDRVGA